MSKIIKGWAALTGLIFAMAFATASSAQVLVAGALPDAQLTAPQFSPVKDGRYSMTWEKPVFVFFSDPGVTGVAAQKDVNPTRAGKMVWVVKYDQAPGLFDNAVVHLCKLQGEWTCGSGAINEIMSKPGDKSWASGKITGGTLAITEIGLAPKFLEAAKADSKITMSVEGFTLVAKLANGQVAWVAIHPAYEATVGNGTKAHAIVADLATGTIQSPKAVPGAAKAFATVVKR